MVLTVLPLLSEMVTVPLAMDDVRFTEPLTALVGSSTCSELFCTITERPTNDEACNACEELKLLAIELTVLFSVVMPSRLLNWANWATNALLSCGSRDRKSVV